MSIDRTKRQLYGFADKQLGQGASETMIEDAEQCLGVKFSTSYRCFLSEFGWGRIGHFELFGLGVGIPHYLDLVEVTQRERTEMEPVMPKHLIPLMNDGAGNHYCLNSRQMTKGECPVVFWDHELGREQRTAVVAISFDAWLFELLTSLDNSR